MSGNKVLIDFRDSAGLRFREPIPVGRPFGVGPDALADARRSPRQRRRRGIGTRVLLEADDRRDRGGVRQLREVDTEIDLEAPKSQTETKGEVKLVLPAAKKGFLKRITFEG